MLTLSFGYKKPQTGDQGATLFTALQDDIQRLNDHDHDGTDSAPLSSAAIVPVTQAIASGSWVLTSQGNYRQLVTLPGALTYDNIVVAIKNSSGHLVYATLEKVSSTTFYVYTNDNSTGFTAVYLT